ncbi:NAD(P)/FAD-dependent oxidoreductase [bacterium SCSIO 12741]|nr:NAD(P)/FAD-dependent oxidoreductase [bacterium SCSIO 12741]
MKNLVIIGNGIAGITTARTVRKNNPNYRITVISSETKHFFSRTALMYIYMGHMKFEHTKPYEDHFWKKNRIDLLQQHVQQIDFDQKNLHFSDGTNMAYDQLVLALGSAPNKFGWPGQDLKGVQGLYSYPDLELMEENTKGIKQAVIVGGGLIGVEMAEMLRSRGIDVTFLVRDQWFWGNVLPEKEGELVAREVRRHGVDLRFNTNMLEILADETGRAKSVKTDQGDEIPCQFVGLTAGVHPNVGFLKDSSLEINRGIVVDEFLQTNIPDVFAAGDCAEMKYPSAGRAPLEQVWYTGRMMGEALGKTLAGNKTAYKPGHWFNSAKFFDIEYQVYGSVPSRPVEGHAQFYWESADGKKCLKLVFDSESRLLIGVHAFGIRMRHEVLDRWFGQKKKVDHLIRYFEDINFDPEFYRSSGPEINRLFNQEWGTALQLEKKSWKRILGI